ncbi:acyl-CoA thioesterase 13 [Plakobranchus ocellatus]|uniref:Acyl-coenzyme A thioesterase 13 n=1 Tax=Plakobranchus ocellatus TaxID=259542 RepID=A0AAV4BKX7_9GAST|nr:acyl-CoA thioesterase 13 [Plakobranchus ocellatus]
MGRLLGHRDTPRQKAVKRHCNKNHPFSGTSKYEKVFMAGKSGGKLALEAVKALVAQRVNSSGFESIFKQMNVVSASDGKCCCELKVQPNMLNVAGNLHGGVTAALVDAVSTYALTTTGQGRPGSSIELNVSYLRPIKKDDSIVISAQTLRCGSTLAVCTVDLTNKSNGQLVAHGKHCKYVGETKAQRLVQKKDTLSDS